MIWTIKVIRLRYCSLRVVPRFAELSEIFYELLRARGDGHGLGEIKRVSANVKAQFPADGYELMEDVNADVDARRVSSFMPWRDHTPAFAFVFFFDEMMVTTEE